MPTSFCFYCHKGGAAGAHSGVQHHGQTEARRHSIPAAGLGGCLLLLPGPHGPVHHNSAQHRQAHQAAEMVVIPKKTYGPTADIWSLGCTVLDMLTRQLPYPDLEWVSARLLMAVVYGISLVCKRAGSNS